MAATDDTPVRGPLVLIFVKLDECSPNGIYGL